MDGLIIPSATLEALQKKADTISASIIIFGVDIAIHKLRSYIANWSSVNKPNNPTQRRMSIADGQTISIDKAGCTSIKMPRNPKHIKQHINNTARNT